MSARSRTWVAGTLAAMLVLGAAPAAGARPRPQIEPLNSARFPNRAYVLTLPQERRLVTADVEVLEDGEPAASPSLTAADSLGDRGFGLVLAIDASYSMRGEPIEAAVAAARAFAARRRPDQLLGILMFNKGAETILPMTSDQAAIDAALASTPELRKGTVVRDAARAAVEMLRADRITGGSVVLLSDGADTASRAGMPDVLDAARRAGARIFTVGLESRAYRRATLEELAERTGGSYAVASSPGRLEVIFDRLGAVLSRQYLLRYRSLAQPSERVKVAVRVRGEDVAATSLYTTPALPGEFRRPFRRSPADVFWLSAAAAVTVALACGLLVGAITLLLLRGRRGGLLERISRFVPSILEEDEHARFSVRRPDRIHSARLTLSGVRRWQRLAEDLDIARLRVSAGKLALLTLAGTVVAMWAFATLSGTGAAALLGLVVPVAVRAFVSVKARRQRRAFAEQLADNVQVVASALRAGHSFVGALAVVVEEAAEPSRREFRRVVNDERLGKTTEQAFSELARRMRNEEIEHVGLVARLQTETGGNTAEVLDRLVDTLRARAELRRLIQTLTAQGRLAGWVVSALPIVVLAALTVLNRRYAEKIFETGSGHVMLVVSAALIVLGSLAIRRIVDIKV
jgi:tight adherence protein B